MGRQKKKPSAVDTGKEPPSQAAAAEALPSQLDVAAEDTPRLTSAVNAPAAESGEDAAATTETAAAGTETTVAPPAPKVKPSERRSLLVDMLAEVKLQAEQRAAAAEAEAVRDISHTWP